MKSMSVALSIAVALACVATPVAAADARDDYAQRLGELINQYRAGQGIHALASDGTLATLAREHSEAMAKSGKLGHEGFESRFGRSGYGMCVENVGWNYHTPQAQLDAWRASSGHDQNMRDPRVAHHGVGVAGAYVTWIACR